MGIRSAKDTAVFIDRDGTLIHEKNYLNRPEDVRLYAGAITALKLLRANGYRIILVTNQSGIGRGLFTEKDLGRVHVHLKALLKSGGVKLDGIYYCPHHPDAGCECRKPRLGMIKKAEKDLNLDLSRSFTIGDHPGDYILGKRMGGTGIFVLTGHGKHEYARLSLHAETPKPDKMFKSLITAARWIVKQNMKHRIVLFVAAMIASFGLGWASESKEDITKFQGIVHEVRWGDTLARLARRYYGDGKKYGIIASANHIANPDRIICGRLLSIPVPAPFEKRQLPDVVQSTFEPVVSALPFQWRQEKCTAFGKREKLTFSVKWKFVTVGSATMEIQGVADINGRKAYHIVTEARSAAFFDAFYRVRDINESWIDTESLCSLKYASKISESNSTRNETLLFDQVNNEFRIEETGKSGPIPPWVQDVLSALYYLRNKELAEGREYSVDAHSGDKSWPLTVKVSGRSKIKVPAGEFETVILEPALREGAGIFQAKGKLQVWMTADERKIPVMMRSKIAVGAIEAQLIKLER